MNEKLLQFIWRFQYFNRSQLSTTKGEKVEIVNPGSLNTNQGPDFLNARIRIGNTLWVGSVEIHLRGSDWQKHGHEGDQNYTNVVLHVVYQHDISINEIPVIELGGRISTTLLERYADLMQSQHFIPCEPMISSVPDLILTATKDRLVAERLQRKVSVVTNFLETTHTHWEESFWWLLARNFGAKTNAEAFEAMARSIPLTLLGKHKSQLIQLEALLLGQAGLLGGRFEEAYPTMLKKEYLFLKSKYALKPVHVPVRFLRMRPSNFPTLRLAQLAALIFNSVHLFSKMIEEPELNKVRSWFAAAPNDFWKYHYSLKDEAHFKEKSIGASMIDNIIVNTVIPFLYVYGSRNAKSDLIKKAAEWLESCRAEKNAITKGFENRGIPHKTAYDSQALIELKTQYCDLKKCLSCPIGSALIKN
ncbi:DUF2851 family protein [Niabella insulamsoli]|uniref:DUF2851 family protein n=1 Tax=Niabella insulamsoli TaxID=3144874 RepID=UPI0031FCAE35